MVRGNDGWNWNFQIGRGSDCLFFNSTLICIKLPRLISDLVYSGLTQSLNVFWQKIIAMYWRRKEKSCIIIEQGYLNVSTKMVEIKEFDADKVRKPHPTVVCPILKSRTLFSGEKYSQYSPLLVIDGVEWSNVCSGCFFSVLIKSTNFCACVSSRNSEQVCVHYCQAHDQYFV